MDPNKEIFVRSYADTYVDVQHGKQGAATVADRAQWRMEGERKALDNYRPEPLIARFDATTASLRTMKQRTAALKSNNSNNSQKNGNMK